MSTNTTLNTAISTGQLVLLKPISPRAQKLRALYVTEKIKQLLEGDTRDEISEDRFGRLRADLEVFVTEPDLYPHYLFWLTPRDDGVWEIRSIADQPTLRVLGLFAERDVFVALTVEERAELGGWESLSWKRAKRSVIQRWQTISQQPPLKGKTENDFFSGAIPGSYWRK